MADEKRSQAEEQADVEEPQEEKKEVQKEKQEEQSSESRIDDKLKELEEKYKKQLAGLDRRNSELENQIEEMQKEKMSEKEKAQFELEKAKKEREQIEVEAKNYRVGLLKAQSINEAELPSEAAEFITAEDEDGIKEQIARLKDFLDKNFKSREEYLSKFGKGTPPKSGNSPERKIEDYNEDELQALAKTNPKKLDELIEEQRQRKSVK